MAEGLMRQCKGGMKGGGGEVSSPSRNSVTDKDIFGAGD